jgi:catechol 2,3-dioxygenase-like lactoylglutathione lyase family enzyme
MEHTNYEVNYIRVGVSDAQQAREFYEDTLGMQLIVDRSDDGYLLFSIGNITLIVETTSPEDMELPKGRYLGISLKVQDINNVYQKLIDEGVKFTHPPEKQFWGGYLTEFYDPDGNIWTLLG